MIFHPPLAGEAQRALGRHLAPLRVSVQNLTFEVQEVEVAALPDPAVAVAVAVVAARARRQVAWQKVSLEGHVTAVHVLTPEAGLDLESACGLRAGCLERHHGNCNNIERTVTTGLSSQLQAVAYHQEEIRMK